MEQESPTSIAKRRAKLVRRFAGDFVLAAAFVAAVFVSKNITEGAPTTSHGAMAALLPAIILTAWFLYLARQIRDYGEFEQMIAVRAVAIAGAITVWGASVWGLFILMAGAPALPLVMAAPFAAFVYSAVHSFLSASFR